MEYLIKPLAQILSGNGSGQQGLSNHPSRTGEQASGASKGNGTVTHLGTSTDLRSGTGVGSKYPRLQELKKDLGRDDDGSEVGVSSAGRVAAQVSEFNRLKP